MFDIYIVENTCHKEKFVMEKNNNRNPNRNISSNSSQQKKIMDKNVTLKKP